MRELVLLCSQEQADMLADAMLDFGVLSVSVEDADVDTVDERPLYGEPGLEPEVFGWRRNRVVALLPDELNEYEIIDHLNATGIVELGPADWELRRVPDEDWVRHVQAQFGPISIGDRILIVPSWRREEVLSEVYPKEDQVLIELDPGLAFGTGSHPTTHLCLEWLAKHVKQGDDVLDYGCGSGVLAIAAKKLGANQVDAVDIDHQAVFATKGNARANQVRLRAMHSDDLPTEHKGQYDIVVANILSNPLKVLAPLLTAYVKPGGLLAISGILAWQAKEMQEAYRDYMHIKAWREREGWVCIVGQRTGAIDE
ncbi:MAG TPA: 50S ribosomal protein L11 methyltransferase [Paenalcaligenes sp.]|nr:50S ribosomal protein L11 methyltransferase [Paenalcaligenes sp.]